MQEKVNTRVIVKQPKPMIFFADSFLVKDSYLAQIGPFFLQEVKGLLRSEVWRDENDIRRIHSSFAHCPTCHAGLLFPFPGDRCVAVTATEGVSFVERLGKGLKFWIRRIVLEQLSKSSIERIRILNLLETVVSGLCM